MFKVSCSINMTGTCAMKKNMIPLKIIWGDGYEERVMRVIA
jgi:hypothetical protein